MTEKQRAILVLAIAGGSILLVLIFTGLIIYFAYPLLLALVLFVIGWIIKKCFEWVLDNIHKFRLRSRARLVKKKLKLDKGVKVVKESIEVLKNEKRNSSN